MELVEDHVYGQIYTYGRQWNGPTEGFVYVPPDLLASPPKIYILAKAVTAQLGIDGFAGVQFGTVVRHTEPLHNTSSARLVT